MSDDASTSSEALLDGADQQPAAAAIMDDPPSPPVLEADVSSAPSVDLNQLPAVAARSVLSALPQHRIAASSVLLVLLALLVAALLILAVRASRRPVLRSRTVSTLGDEWAPINGERSARPDDQGWPTVGSGAAEASAIQLPEAQRHQTAPTTTSYNTFASDEDEAWQAAKRDWHAAIAAAKRLHTEQQQQPSAPPD